MRKWAFNVNKGRTFFTFGLFIDFREHSFFNSDAKFIKVRI
jgi:hypothetical protein